MEGKRGLEMAITTMIMIILSISVLAVLVFFFNTQTGFLSNFFESSTPESNVDVVVNACNAHANSGGTYTYCCDEKNVVFGKGDEENGEYTCLAASAEGWGQEIVNYECPVDLC